MRGGATVQDFLYKLRDTRACSPVTREFLDLCVCRNLASEQKPEKSLGEGLGPAGCLRELLLAILDGLAAEANTLLYKE